MEPASKTQDFTEMVIRMDPNRKTVIVEEHKPGNVVAYKEISVIDLYFSLFSSYMWKDFLSSGFLPDNCLSVALCGTERRYYLWNHELRADITYRETEYPDFPIPRLVFGIRMLENGRVAECSLGVVADEKPTPESIMYYYPFSNVYKSGKVCAGNNVLPKYRDPRKLWQFPRYLLGLPDNDDFYDIEHNRLMLDHKELLEHLKDKDPAYYYSDILVPNGKVLQDFIDGR